MRTRLFLTATLCCLFFLGGCATSEKSARPATASRFPETPAPFLAKSPEQCLLADGSIGTGAACRGGWGYKRVDAFVLGAPSGRRPGGGYYSTVALEKRLIHARNRVEFAETPEPGKRFAVLDYGTISRTVGEHEGRMYAVWKGQVKLAAEAEAPQRFQGANGRSVGAAAPVALAEARSVSREYWFDVTETFALNSKNPKVPAAAPLLPAGSFNKAGKFSR